MKKYFTLLFITFCVNGTAVAQLSFLDPSFGSGGIVITPPPMATVYEGGSFISVVVQTDNKIVAVGSQLEQAVIIRYNENGTIDSSFAINGIFAMSNIIIHAIVLQTDGKLLTEGSIDTGAYSTCLTMRLNTDGSLDNTFGIGGMATTAFSAYNNGGYNIALQDDNKIVIIGEDNDTYVGLARLLPNGTPDSTFGINGIVTTSYYRAQATGVSVMPDGRIVTAGTSYTYLFMAMRFLSDGSADTSFNHTGMVTTGAGDSYNICNALQLQSDSKIVLAGSGDFGVNEGDFTLIRYNTDGSLDRSFGDTGVANIDFNENDDEATALYLQQDGKLIVTGNSNTRFGLVCIYSNGTIDSTFGNYGRITTTIQNGDDVPRGIAVQPDGKIVLAGWSYDSGRLGDDPTLVRYINTTVAVPQLINNEDIAVLYPNPSPGNLNIKGSVSHIISVTACDAAGNQIRLKADLPDHQVFISGIADGLYFFRISYNDHPPDVQKIIIQNR